jgi:hypothetical protein
VVLMQPRKQGRTGIMITLPLPAPGGDVVDNVAVRMIPLGRNRHRPFTRGAGWCANTAPATTLATAVAAVLEVKGVGGKRCVANEAGAHAVTGPTRYSASARHARSRCRIGPVSCADTGLMFGGG